MSDDFRQKLKQGGPGRNMRGVIKKRLKDKTFPCDISIYKNKKNIKTAGNIYIMLPRIPALQKIYFVGRD